MPAGYACLLPSRDREGAKFGINRNSKLPEKSPGEVIPPRPVRSANCDTLVHVGFGHFTKQLAKEAIGNQVKDMMDSLRPSDAAGPAAQASPDNLAVAIVAQVQAMQNALKDDMELIAVCTIGAESMRVLEIFAPSSKLLVLTGIDTDRTVTRVISPAESLQLICKPQPVQAGGKATRIKLIVPKSRPEKEST